MDFAKLRDRIQKMTLAQREAAYTEILNALGFSEEDRQSIDAQMRANAQGEPPLAAMIFFAGMSVVPRYIPTEPGR